jgi:hypothetical protein
MGSLGNLYPTTVFTFLRMVYDKRITLTEEDTITEQTAFRKKEITDY